jgi:hypothetical protein
MTDREFFDKTGEIGPAVWLLTAYWWLSKPHKWPWFTVFNGEPVTDEEFAALLNVSPYTIKRWRKRLMRAGVVEAKRAEYSAQHRQWREEFGMVFKGVYRIRVQRPPLAVAVLRTLEAHSEDRERWEAPLATQTIQ